MAATSKIVPVMWSILCYFIAITCVHASKLNVPKVLLPYYSSVASNFTLEVSDGCYKWRSTRSEIATVVPVKESSLLDPDSCSSHAVVTAVSKTATRMTSVIIAEDPVSGQQLRCDVIVAVIHDINVETTTRELYLEDSPEQFEVRAQDDEGNVFSSLEGISFEWSLISDTDVDQDSIVDAHNVLRILPFAESSYETPPYIEALERVGKQGNTLLVEGIRTGSAKVSVRLLDPVYKNIPETQVRLIVIANIELNPPVVYLMQNCQVQYKVQLRKQGKMTDIPMPHQQYYLELKDPKLCQLNPDTSIVTAQEFGYTDIVLKDKNIKVKEAFRQPSAGIYVVTPGYLGFVCLPGRKWVLETGRDYEILIEIYDKDSHKLYASDNLRVVGELPEEYFKVYKSTVNGTHYYVRTLKRGNTMLKGQLRSVILEDGTEFEFKQNIRTVQDVEIYDPIKVLPEILVFPWNPTSKATYTYPLKAVGGSGNYTWSSADGVIVSVNVRGVITTAAMGHTTVTAADVRNAAHTGTMKTYIVPPSQMEFVPSKVEAEIDSSLELPLAIFGVVDGKQMAFADCRHLKYSVEVVDKSVFQYANEILPLRGDSCTTIKVKALKLGHTEVRVSYTSQNVKLSASVTIAAYKPLRAIDPEAVAVVTVGSSYEVIFEGGPQPWVLDTAKFFQKASAEDESVSSLQRTRAPQKNLHMFRVLCKSLGEQDLTVAVGNGITSKNKFPATATSSIKFVCASPVGLHLTPVVSHPTGFAPCPIMPDSPEAVPVPNYKNLEIVVWVTDSNGRRFNNFSSLAFDWELTDNKLASFRNSASMKSEVIVGDFGKKTTKTYQVVELKNKLGSLSVLATINKYDRSHFTKQAIYFQVIHHSTSNIPGFADLPLFVEAVKKAKLTVGEEIDPPISGSLDLMTIEDATIIPEYVTIFNHPSNKAELQIRGGSGYFHLDHAQTNTAVISYDRKSRMIKVSPLSDGLVTITAYDLCVDSDHHASSRVQISGVNTINLRVLDKVQLDREIMASVSVLDEMGQPLLSSYFPQMGLQAHPGSNIIHIREDPEKAEDPYTANFLVYGKVLGRTTLQFMANTPQGKVVSPPREIQVFPPLTLDPKNITLIVGALFQVMAHGGPQPQSTIEFSINKANIAGISTSGLLDTQELGYATVTGRAVGYEGDTGQKIVYSSDTMTVHVVELTGLRIHAPLKRLQSGTQMPLYAMGLNEHLTPFTFGSAVPPILFQWTLNNKEAVSLRNIYYKSNIEVGKEGNFAMQLHAHQAGHVTIGLTATSHSSNMQIKRPFRFRDEVQIQIFEELQLLAPKTCSGQLLMTPDTETQLKTNRDSAAFVTYQVDSASNEEPVVTVNEAGQVVSGHRFGQALLIITAHEDFGVNQTVVILVKVKMVSYLMVRAETELHTSAGLASIPVGTNMKYRVTLHDDLGHEFYATNTPIKYRTNRNDLVHIHSGSENNTLVARTTSVGQTIFKVWVKDNPRMADYVNMNVGHAIDPTQSHVTLGDIICFTSPILSSAGHSGRWSSSSSTVHIRYKSGIAVASSVGSAVVTYDVPDTLSTHTEVSVKPASEVRLLDSSVDFLTDVATKYKSVTVPVVLLSDDPSRTNNLHGNNCSAFIQTEHFRVSSIPFSCEISLSPPQRDLDIHDLFHADPTFDLASGQYLCELTAAELLTDLRTQVSSLEASVQLRVKVKETEQQKGLTSKVLSLPFLPGFYLHTTEVQISNLKPQGMLRLSATAKMLEHIQVTSSDPTTVEVLDWKLDKQFYVFPVRLNIRSDLWETGPRQVNLEVKCATLAQKTIIPVMIKLSSSTSGKAAEELGLWGVLTYFCIHQGPYILTMIFTICCLVIGISWLRGGQYQATSNTSGVFLPTGSSPPPAYDTNPWTPAYSPAGSPNKVSLWTSGYDITDTSIHRRSPSNRSPYRS